MILNHCFRMRLFLPSLTVTTNYYDTEIDTRESHSKWFQMMMDNKKTPKTSIWHMFTVEKEWKSSSKRWYRHKVIITFILRVTLLPPLRDEHCDLAMSSSPEVLNGQSDASTGEEHSQTVTAEDPALSSDHIHKCTYSWCESGNWTFTPYKPPEHTALLIISCSVTPCLLESVSRVKVLFILSAFILFSNANT